MGMNPTRIVRRFNPVTGQEQSVFLLESHVRDVGLALDVVAYFACFGIR